MPRVTITATVQQPCHESWQQMPPTAQGRHCAACAKVVVDFTRKTDAELLAWLRSSERVCGRFRADQLNRPLHSAPSAAPRWHRWLTAAAALWALHEAAPEASLAQTSPATEQAPQVPRRPTPAQLETIIRGRVLDSAQQPLPGVTVLLKGSVIGVSTDYNGVFSLAIPSSYHSAQNAQLQVSSVGYFTQELSLANWASRDIVLAVNLQAMADVVVMGGCSLTRWYSPRGFAQRIRRWFIR